MSDQSVEDPQRTAGSSREPREFGVALACAVGLLAALAPWLAHALDWTEKRASTDLWYGFALFLVALFAWTLDPPRRANRIVVRACGGLAVTIAIVNAPRLIRLVERGAAGGFDTYLAGGARYDLMWYAIVALAGLRLVLTGRPAQVRGVGGDVQPVSTASPGSSEDRSS